MAGFRTIVINKRCKLESLLGYLVIRSEKEERINMNEIETLIIESTAIALTSASVVDLTEAGVNIIFCDRSHLPTSVFSPINSHFSSAKNIKIQINWNDKIKVKCWKLIVKEKIKQQSFALNETNNFEFSHKLLDMCENVKDNDIDNQEALAAKIYFSKMFNNDFTRHSSRFENIALNYGYALILSTFVKEIVACGYITEIGIWHHSFENAYNLASDFMEPFRIIVDLLVYDMPNDQEENFKRYMQKTFSSVIEINGDKQYLVTAIRIYLHKIFSYLKGESDSIYGFNIIRENKDNEL